MDTALYVFVLKKKRYVAFINCLACRFSAAGEQLESVKYVACNIVHFFEIDALSSHLILHISLTFHRRRT